MRNAKPRDLRFALDWDNLAKGFHLEMGELFAKTSKIYAGGAKNFGDASIERL